MLGSQFSPQSMQMIRNVESGFCNHPMFANYETNLYTLPYGLVSLVTSKSGRVINRFDFIPGNNGQIESITIYGDALNGHANAIKASMKCFALPVSNVSLTTDCVEVTLADY